MTHTVRITATLVMSLLLGVAYAEKHPKDIDWSKIDLKPALTFSSPSSCKYHPHDVLCEIRHTPEQLEILRQHYRPVQKTREVEEVEARALRLESD